MIERKYYIILLKRICRGLVSLLLLPFYMAIILPVAVYRFLWSFYNEYVALCTDLYEEWKRIFEIIFNFKEEVEMAKQRVKLQEKSEAQFERDFGKDWRKKVRNDRH